MAKKKESSVLDRLKEAIAAQNFELASNLAEEIAAASAHEPEPAKKKGRPKGSKSPKKTTKAPKAVTSRQNRRVDDFVVDRNKNRDVEESDDEEEDDDEFKSRGAACYASPFQRGKRKNIINIEEYKNSSEFKAADKADKVDKPEQFKHGGRPPAKKVKVVCRGCGRSSRVYRSQIPQRVAADDTDGPRYLCNSCSKGGSR